MLSAAYVLMYEAAHGADAGLQEDERHHVMDLDEALAGPVYLSDPDEIPEFDPEERARQIREMQAAMERYNGLVM